MLNHLLSSKVVLADGRERKLASVTLSNGVVIQLCQKLLNAIHEDVRFFQDHYHSEIISML